MKTPERSWQRTRDVLLFVMRAKTQVLPKRPVIDLGEKSPFVLHHGRSELEASLNLRFNDLDAGSRRVDEAGSRMLLCDLSHPCS